MKVKWGAAAVIALIAAALPASATDLRGVLVREFTNFGSYWRIERRHLDQRTACLGNHKGLPLRSLIYQFRKVSLRFMNIHNAHSQL